MPWKRKESKWKSILNTKSILLCIVRPFELDIIISRLYRYCIVIATHSHRMDKNPAGIQCLKVSGNKNRERMEENRTEKYLSCRLFTFVLEKRGCKKVAVEKGKIPHSINFYFIVFSNVCFDIITIRRYLLLNSWYIVLNYKRSSSRTIKFKVVKVNFYLSTL